MKLFKKLAAIALVAVMALAMVGCYSAPAGATLNDKQATALVALVNTERKAANKEELNRSTEAEAILADYAKAMVDYLVDQNETTDAAGAAAAQEAMSKLSQLEIDGKKVDMSKSKKAVGLAKGVTATPEMIKNATMNSMKKDGETITTVDTWTPIVNADGSYLAVVWAEKSGATAVIVYNIVLAES